jgi:DNA-binding XRE family transcriptional regulator
MEKERLNDNFVHLFLINIIIKNIYMRNEVYKKIPNLLLKYRKISGFTQKQVAKVLGVHHSVLCKWEDGSCIPNLVSVFKLAVLYSTMADALFIDLIHHLRKEMKEKIEKFQKK